MIALCAESESCIYNIRIMKPADLIHFLSDGETNILSNELFIWVDASPRFTAFIETYRDKIRKKIRINRELENLLDVRCELEVAYCLLKDRRLNVEYEPYANTQKRGPDFAVTYRTNLKFNIEVARMRVEESGSAGNDLQRKEQRVLRILLSKLGQMQPGMPNLLVICPRLEIAQLVSLEKLMQEVKTRAEGKDSSFYAISHYASPAAFYKDFLHLSGILFWTAGGQLWINKQARPALDSKAVALVSSLTACSS